MKKCFISMAVLGAVNASYDVIDLTSSSDALC